MTNDEANTTRKLMITKYHVQLPVVHNVLTGNNYAGLPENSVDKLIFEAILKDAKHKFL